MKRSSQRQSQNDRRGSASAFSGGSVTGGGRSLRGAAGTLMQQLTKGRRNKPSTSGSATIR